MSQKLLPRMRNEWRSNVWLAVELLIVSVVLWFITDSFYVTQRLSSRDTGFDIENCYLITTADLTEKSPEYIPDQTPEDKAEATRQLLDRLSRRPEVEAASVSMNAFPYNGSNSGGYMTVDTFVARGYVIDRRVSPEFPRVFRYRGVDGATPEQLAEELRRDRLLISSNLMADDYPDLEVRSLVEHKLFEYDDSSYTKTIGAVLQDVLYSDLMQGQMNRTIVRALEPGQYSWASEFCVRVKPGMEEGFIDGIMRDAESSLAAGNLRIVSVKSFDDIRDNFMRNDVNRLRNFAIGAIFLLVNIFLGLLGTFWFRTQQRVGDIAVSKVCGATRSDIFRLLVGEGLLLLTIVTPIALLIDFNLTHMELNAYYDGGFFSWPRLLICGGIAYVLMALMIVLGVSIPARRAMNIAPAEALRDE